MHAKTNKRKEKREMGTKKGRSTTIMWVVAVVLAAALAVPGIALALTPAGTDITNQAEATWTDVNNNSYSQFSNTTTVTVDPVYGILLVEPIPGDKTGVPLDNVSYGYRIQNTGNATDNYALTAVSVPAWATSMYVDNNVNGIYDTGDTAVSSPVQINAEDNVYIVVVVTIPAATPDGTTADTTLTVTGALGGAEDDASDVSTTTVQAPVLGVVKNVRNVTDGGGFDNTATAAPNEELEYRITVTNNGSSDASTLVLSDPLDGNTGYRLVPGATFTAGTSGLTLDTVTFSHISTPTVYTYIPADQGCSAPAGYDYCVAGVRWTMTGSMEGSGANFNVNFIVLVK